MSHYKMDIKASGMEKFAHQEIHDSPEMEALFTRIKKVLGNNSLDNKSFSVHVQFSDKKGENKQQIVDEVTPEEAVMPAEDGLFIFQEEGCY